ncbi:vascular adhesin/metalloprotease pallilysin [Treponema pallidum]|uniref:vascular adhesin/metalloprotease pallilysin n=1 Tax=Treponema pallidum TaxID=160 RepID=UPI002005B7D9|nr:vascular adhesin/metalloprotease pallilysin [Treponema pallidum]UPN52028.1 laminin-binding protein [Treponema pallidum subsp. endemicum]UPN52856.1 laminin-binding protein [Treponema pallidum subsp. endemicum]
MNRPLLSVAGSLFVAAWALYIFSCFQHGHVPPRRIPPHDTFGALPTAALPSNARDTAAHPSDTADNTSGSSTTTDPRSHGNAPPAPVGGAAQTHTQPPVQTAMRIALWHRATHGEQGALQHLLAGLWIQTEISPNSGDIHPLLFFDREHAEITFSRASVQEIFLVDSAHTHRKTVSFLTRNTAISSIRRRLEVTFESHEVIHVRAVEDVARLKIGSTSMWDGQYTRYHAGPASAPSP